jgi:hypothetical protein
VVKRAPHKGFLVGSIPAVLEKNYCNLRFFNIDNDYKMTIQKKLYIKNINNKQLYPLFLKKTKMLKI